MASISAPIITASVVDTNPATIALTGDSSILVRYHSNACAEMTVTPQQGTTIAEDYLIIRNGGATGYGYSYTFEEVGSPSFTFSAEDDRGNVATKTMKARMVEYVRLTCNIANCQLDASGKLVLSCNGNYFDGSFGDWDNWLTVQYSYTGSDGSYGYGDMNWVTSGGNTYSAYAELSDLDYQETYTFTITASDQLEEVRAIKSAVENKPIFHWSKDDFAFEVPVKFNSTGATTFQNLNATNLNATNLKVNGYTTWGTWTPRLNVTDKLTAEGWYQRLGNVVTIGWYIEGDISSGNHGNTIEISGIPYFPATIAFGGGLAYKVYVTAGHAFECWCVDTTGKITGRTQPCNNTSAGNLNIGSTVNYPSGSETIKLSGTICYMV